MNLITPYAKMLSPRSPYESFTKEDGITLLRNIEYYARISHRSEDAITDESYDRILRSVVLNHGDFSVIEHEKVTVEAYVDRGITHEWVRHRLFSYTQESTRFVNYAKKMLPSFVKPLFTDQQVKEGAEIVWETTISSLEKSYEALVNMGCAPQIARSLFPNGLASKIVATGNLRSWRHFFIMRTSKETHPQMKEVSIPLLHEFQSKIPILFEDLIPEQRQADAMKNLR